MKRSILILVAVLIVACGAYLFRSGRGTGKPIIAILQTATHPALNAACEGFVSTVREHFGTECEIVIKNADGLTVNAQAAAASLTSKSEIIAFYAIGTPALQALVSKESKRPIFYTAVTYPDRLGLLKPNVVGASDYFDLNQLIECVHTLLPESTRIGILYNPGTEVACNELKELENACRSHGKVPVKIGGTTEMEIINALKSNMRKIDLCVVPTDNMIASVLPSLCRYCSLEKIPVIAAWQTALVDGATAACGMDYTQLGVAVGGAAVDVLKNGKKLTDLGSLNVSPQVVVQQDLLKK